LTVLRPIASRALLLAGLACASLSCLTPPASAQEARSEDATSFTPGQRKEIVGILRDALKTDPSILSDAIAALRQGAQRQAQDKALAGVKSDVKALQTGPAYTVRGNPSGDVTVVEFYDPRCGYCRAMVPLVDKLLAQDHGIRLIEKAIPIISEKSIIDVRAILAAARQNGYDKMKRALMQDKQEPSLDRVRQIATANGLNADKLAADMKDKALAAEINGNLALAQNIGLDGTPTFVFGTASVIPGAVSLDDMKTEIDKARHEKS